MRLHLLQLDLAWESRRENLARVERALAPTPVSPGDLLILPEMFDSGFSLNVEAIHDGAGETLGFLKALARRLRCTVHGSRTLLGPDGMGRNCATVVGPGGDRLCEYAKIHPFTYGREGERFAGGEEVTTYVWRVAPNTPSKPLSPALRAGPIPAGEGPQASARGTNELAVCPAVCYDLRFPELFRRALDLGAEAFAIGANWPTARAAHWRALLVARAIENQAFVFGVNRAGADPHLTYSGGSLAVGPKGEILAEAGDAQTVLSVAIDPGAVRAWRDEFPAWRDRRLGLPPPARDTSGRPGTGPEGEKSRGAGPETSRPAHKSHPSG